MLCVKSKCKDTQKFFNYTQTDKDFLKFFKRRVQFSIENYFLYRHFTISRPIGTMSNTLSSFS